MYSALVTMFFWQQWAPLASLLLPLVHHAPKRASILVGSSWTWEGIELEAGRTTEPSRREITAECDRCELGANEVVGCSMTACYPSKSKPSYEFGCAITAGITLRSSST